MKGSSRKTRPLMIGTSLAAMLIAGVASAQVTTGPGETGPAHVDPQTQGQQSSVAPATVPVTPAADAPTGTDGIALGDIVVTAQKRETSLQRTPLSIVALGGEDLRKSGKTNVQEAIRGVPNVQLNGNGANGSFTYIRGVGNNPRFTGDPSVVLSVDGVFNQRGNAIQDGLYDIQRVEVARGPQTTLQGRTAEGGSLNLITNVPKLGKISAGFTGSVGNAGLRTAEIYGNLPVTDWLAVRIAGTAAHRDPLLTDGTGGRKLEAGRIRVLVEPTSDIRLILSADTSLNRAPQNLNGANTGFINLGAPFSVANGYYFSRNPNNTTTRYTSTDYYADLDWDFGFATLHVQPTYQRTTLAYGIYSTNETTYQRALLTTTAQPVPYNDAAAYARATTFTGTNSVSRQKTLEVRLSSPATQALSWIVGGYYFTNTQVQSSTAASGTSTGTPAAAVALLPQGYLLPIYSNSPRRDSTDYDAFAEVTYHFNQSNRLTAGGRYSTAERGRGTVYGFDRASDGTIINTNLSIPKDNGVVGTTTPGAATGTLGVPSNSFVFNILGQNRTFHDFNYRVVAEHDLAPRSLIYGSISTGWKAGNFNYIPADNDVCPVSQGCVAAAPYIAPGYSAAYQSEHLMAYEIGSKNTFADGQLRVNVAVFYYNYDNYQFDYLANYVNPATGVDPDYTATITSNAKKAESYGGEVEINFVATSKDRINLAGGYLHARIKELGYNASATAAFQAYANALTNFQLPRSPKFTGTASYSHLFDLNRAGTFEFTGTVSYSSHQNLVLPATLVQLSSPSYYQQSPFSKVDLNLLYTAPNHAFTVNAFVRNLTNKVTYDGKTIPSAFPAPSATTALGSTTASGSTNFYPSEPRMYGAALSISF